MSSSLPSPAHSARHRPFGSTRSAALAGLLAGLLALAVLGSAATPASGGEPGTRSLGEAREELERAERKLERLAEQKAEAEALVVELEAERVRIDREVARLDADAVEFQRQLQAARRDARLATVEAYVTGNRQRQSTADLDGSAEALWEETILTDRADARVEASLRYRELRTRAEEAVVALADDADRVDARIRQAESDIDRSIRLMAATRRRIADLRIEIQVLQIVAQYAGRRPDPGAGAWAALRNCESGGNYGTNTGNGFYGAYQFDLQTWRSMGGSGLPSAAPDWEQDARAKVLYQTRGSQPWPVCGRYL